MSSLHETSISDPAHILDRLNTFYGKISEYRRLDRFTDVKIVCQDGRTFRCHRVALAAASEYFDVMFSANFREGRSDRDVHLQNIDSSSFEHILEYAYSGKVVPIDDENVYPLLFTSDYLRIPDIEKHCTHYLCEKNIPMDHALYIYLLASRLEKKTIKSVTGKFIFEHLVQFCHDRQFLRVPFRDLSPILKHFETSTKSREKALLNVIFQWVSNLEDMEGDNMRFCFLELTQQVRFEFMSQRSIEAYFNRKEQANRFNLQGDADERPTDSEDLNFMAEKKEPTLYAFFVGNNNLDVFSLIDTDEQAEWHHSCRTRDSVNELRVVELNGLLYSMEWCFGSREWTFGSSTKIDLRTNRISLAVPSSLGTDLGFDPHDTNVLSHYHPYLSMCSLRGRVYLADVDEGRIPFQYYNPELDTWSVIQNVTSDELMPICMASNNNRIYTIMRQMEICGDSVVFRAYDPRAGRLEALNIPGIIPPSSEFGDVDCCFLRNKMYISSIEREAGSGNEKRTLRLLSYDLPADRWDVLNMGCRYLWYDMPLFELVSDDRKLWMFSYSESKGNGDDYCHVVSYDPFIQKWDTTGCSAKNIHCDPRAFLHAVPLKSVLWP